MIQRYSYKGITWLDLDHPTDKDIDDIIKEFKIDGVIANELSTPSVKPRVEMYHDFIYLVLNFPAFKHSHSDKTEQEVDFIIGRNFLVTARYDTLDAIHKFAKQIEVKSILDKNNIEFPSGHIFYMILKEIYSAIFDELLYIESWQKNIETKIFKGDERNMVFDLSNVSRTLLDFQKTMDAHKEVLVSLEIIGKKFLGDHFSLYTRATLEEYYKIQNTIKNLRDVVVELRETNNSLLDTKQNEITKVLTIMAFIAVPLSLIVSIFQIDTISRPIIGHPNDFWILIGGIFAVGAIMFSFFKFKHWL